jgi:hypothetical protein
MTPDLEAPPPPLRLSAGRGFETRATRHAIGDCIVVDAAMPSGLRAPLHAHERAYVTLILAGGFDERYGRASWSGGAGAVNFVPSGAAHSTVSHGARLVRIEFPEAVMADARRLGSILDQPGGLDDPAVATIARRVLAEVRAQDDGWRLVAQGLVTELLGHAVRGQLKAEAGRPPPGCAWPASGWTRNGERRRRWARWRLRRACTRCTWPGPFAPPTEHPSENTRGAGGCGRPSGGSSARRQTSPRSPSTAASSIRAPCQRPSAANSACPPDNTGARTEGAETYPINEPTASGTYISRGMASR